MATTTIETSQHFAPSVTSSVQEQEFANLIDFNVGTALPIGSPDAALEDPYANPASPMPNQSENYDPETFAIAKVSEISQMLGKKRMLLTPLPRKDGLSFLGLKPKIADMTLNEKFECLAQSLSYTSCLLSISIEVFESITTEFKTYEKIRAGMPTVEEAFRERGLPYQTIYSRIRREKKRRAEDAQFFAAIKAAALARDAKATEIAAGTTVVESTGRRAIVVNQASNAGTNVAEIRYQDDGTTEIKKCDALVSLADIRAAKATARSARKRSETETVCDETFATNGLGGSSCKHNCVAFAILHRGDEKKLFNILSEKRGGDSVISKVFGSLGESLASSVQTFAQRILDQQYDGMYVVTVTEKSLPQTCAGEEKPVAAFVDPGSTQATSIGYKSSPTPNGFLYEFRKHPTHPYVVRNANKPELGVIEKFKSRADAELKVATCEREAVAIRISERI